MASYFRARISKPINGTRSAATASGVEATAAAPVSTKAGCIVVDADASVPTSTARRVIDGASSAADTSIVVALALGLAEPTLVRSPDIAERLVADPSDVATDRWETGPPSAETGVEEAPARIVVSSVPPTVADTRDAITSSRLSAMCAGIDIVASMGIAVVETMFPRSASRIDALEAVEEDLSVSIQTVFEHL